MGRIRSVFPNALKTELQELVPATLAQVVRGFAAFDVDSDFPACSIQNDLGLLNLEGAPATDEFQRATTLVTVWDKITSDKDQEQAEDALEALSEAVVDKILEPDSRVAFRALSPCVYLDHEDLGPAIEWLGFVVDEDRQLLGLQLAVNYNGVNEGA